jgi:osmotically-inducible protein OsmY
VQTSEQKDRAQKIAEDTPGVEDVINNITVRDERPDARR